ncbi:MAG: flagellar basal body L-ring protein FlgH [Bdellovibrionaceae bacterium]|nr:flagellar basal body L-ring protein FlgH [Pseudobdellovibrionaceae bacterium]
MSSLRALLFGCFIVAAVLSAGCATWESAKESVGLVPTTPEGETIEKFSDNPNMLNVANRNYKRMTRQRMEEEAEIHSQAGSMWVNDGQGAYLFAQNKSRREGDLLNVKIEGAAQKQIETKVAVIKKLLKQLEDEELKSQKPQQNLADGGGDAKRAPASAPAAPKSEEKDEPLQLEAVPTRIVERMADGNYRVKGQQPFMIGKREYKVIVTGLIRPEDFNDEGVGSGKLLDPQYDVVSIRKKEKASL